MPNAATLMSEYAPERRRALLVNLMFVGFPMGSSLGGFLSAWMIPHYGWQSVLVLGGVMPLLLAVALIFLLPESARYLVVKRSRRSALPPSCAVSRRCRRRWNLSCAKQAR
jgi:AAHS family 4-hydroxybenzoate transporter-like MFS transporter